MTTRADITLPNPRNKFPKRRYRSMSKRMEENMKWMTAQTEQGW